MRVRNQTLEEQQLLLVTEPSLQGPLSLLKRKSAFFFHFFNFPKLKLQNIIYRDLKTSLLGLFVRNKNGDLMSTLSKELTFENGVMMFALCGKGQIRQKWFHF